MQKDQVEIGLNLFKAQVLEIRFYSCLKEKIEKKILKEEKTYFKKKLKELE